MLIDTHCHIYLPEFDTDRDMMMTRAKNAGVNRFIMPAIDSSTHEQMLAMEQQYPEEAISMMGLHPCSVNDNYKEELNLVKDWLSKRPFAAVGEIGLDYYWDTSRIAEQQEVFSTQITWALEYDLPIIIHSRNSIDDCIRLVAAQQDGRLKGVFHCFSGTAEQARQIIDLGFYLGIGGVLTFKNAGLDKVVAGLSLDNLLLETDAPYLAPVPHRGKRNECSYIKLVAEKLGIILEKSVEEVASVTTANAIRLFKLKS